MLDSQLITARTGAVTTTITARTGTITTTGTELDGEPSPFGPQLARFFIECLIFGKWQAARNMDRERKK